MCGAFVSKSDLFDVYHSLPDICSLGVASEYVLVLRSLELGFRLFPTVSLRDCKVSAVLSRLF